MTDCKLNLESYSTSDFFDGAIVSFEPGTINDKKIICFLVDVTKTNDFKGMFESDVFVVQNDFSIEAVLAYNLGILPENQIIVKGEYPLYSYYDIKFWYIELDNWIKE